MAAADARNPSWGLLSLGTVHGGETARQGGSGRFFFYLFFTGAFFLNRGNHGVRSGCRFDSDGGIMGICPESTQDPILFVKEIRFSVKKNCPESNPFFFGLLRFWSRICPSACLGH